MTFFHFSPVSPYRMAVRSPLPGPRKYFLKSRCKTVDLPPFSLAYNMISRRNIRVKVMQTLYAMDTMEQETVKPGTAMSLLNEKLDQTCQIFTYLLFSMARVAQYAETDAQQRASKHLPSAEDLSVNTKIAGNDFVFQVLNDKGFLVNLDTGSSAASKTPSSPANSTISSPKRRPIKRTSPSPPRARLRKTNRRIHLFRYPGEKRPLYPARGR